MNTLTALNIYHKKIFILRFLPGRNPRERSISIQFFLMVEY